MDDDPELLLFDLSTVHKVTHNVAKRACAERGIKLQIHDIALQETRELNTKHRVKGFPKCILFRNGREIGHTHIVWLREKDLTKWIDDTLAADAASSG